MIVHLAVGPCSYEARLLEGNLWHKCCMKINHHRFPLMRLQWSLIFKKLSQESSFSLRTTLKGRTNRTGIYKKVPIRVELWLKKEIIKLTTWKRGKTGGARLESFPFWLVEKKTWYFLANQYITNWQSLSCNRYWGRSGPQFNDASAKRETSERKEKRKPLFFFSILDARTNVTTKIKGPNPNKGSYQLKIKI